MEYMPGGDLYGLLQRKEVLHEDHARFYISEIVLAVRYLHKKNVIHRDLKLPNVLIGLDGHVKVSDFGLCKLDISADGKTNTFCGTPEYIAPEVVKFQAYGPSVDWWAVGVMSYRMVILVLNFFSILSFDLKNNFWRAIKRKTTTSQNQLILVN